MQTPIATTPFGRRSLSLGMLATQITAQAVKPDEVVHKWHVFKDIKEARQALGATDRALAILDALLSFHPETAFYGDSALIVWPSNEQLIGRANGMSPATLRRHLANLVACGLVIRRDSPNGKRFARKGHDGEVEQAYGFDLSPIVARAGQFKAMALAVRAEKKAHKLAKEKLTLRRRDIVKMIETGIDEGVPGDWGRVQQAYQAIVGRLVRTPSLALLNAVSDELDELWCEIREVLETFINSNNLNANESQSEHHIQNSKSDAQSDSESGLEIKEELGSTEAKTATLRSLPRRDLPLGIVLDACPSLVWLGQGGGIGNWREFLAAAQAARPMLAISPSAWEDAKLAMGEKDAAITLAAIYQRHDHISSPGGYLRSLTERAKAAKFSTWPMVMALLRAKLDAAKAGQGSVPQAQDELATAAAVKRAQGRLDISDGLRRSLERTRRG